MNPKLQTYPALRRLGLAVLLAASGFAVHAQPYAISWYKIAGGGGTSSNGLYQISGTIGQPDASAALSGGGYAVTGGFWSRLSVVQTAGLPNLVIVPLAPKGARILWPDPATNRYTLQQTPSLSSPSWATSGYPITSVNGTNSVTIPTPAGNLFFRLKQ